MRGGARPAWSFDIKLTVYGSQGAESVLHFCKSKNGIECLLSHGIFGRFVIAAAWKQQVGVNDHGFCLACGYSGLSKMVFVRYGLLRLFVTTAAMEQQVGETIIVSARNVAIMGEHGWTSGPAGRKSY